MTSYPRYTARCLPSDVEADCAAGDPRVPTLGLPVNPSRAVGRHETSILHSAKCDSGVCLSSPAIYSNTDSLRSESLSSTLEVNEERTDSLGLNTQFGRLDISQTHDEKDTFVSLDEGICQSVGICQSIANEEQQQELLKAYEQGEDGDTWVHLSIIQSPAYAGSLICSAPSWDVLNIQNNLQQTPLHLAALTDQPYLCRQLLIHGALIDTRDRHGNTALHICCDMGQFACVKELTRPLTHQEVGNLSYSVPFQKLPQDLSIQNYRGETCLYLARNHFNVLDYLLSKCGADVNERDWKSGRTLLHRAVESNNVELVNYLLSRPDLDVNRKTYDGCTAFQLAVGRQLGDIAQLLLMSGAERTELASDDDMDGMDELDDMVFNGQTVRLAR